MEELEKFYESGWQFEEMSYVKYAEQMIWGYSSDMTTKPQRQGYH